jgi:mono/diheme cytochrome c family protein
MKLVSRAAAGVLALLAAGALPARAGDAAAPPLAGGAALFRQYCAACHGADARGAGPLAEVLRTPPPDLTGIAKRRGGRFPEVRVRKLIDGRRTLAAHGSRDMPVWGERFTYEEPLGKPTEPAVRSKLILLTEYLASIQEP